MQTDTILLIPQKADEERESVLRTWKNLGGEGRRLDRFWEKPADLADKKVAVYGNDTFALVLAQIYDLKLISPDDTLISRLDKKWTKRSIQEKNISDIGEKKFPIFIKPVTPKQFKAKVYDSVNEFLQETKGISPAEKILISGIIRVDAEARAFVLNRRLLDVAIYEGVGELQTGKEFLLDFLKDSTFDLPNTIVIDIGYNSDQAWFIVEFNSCWGAGLNNCDPTKVIEAIIEASQ